MAILKIVKDGDPLLRKVSRPVEEITPRILTMLDDMVETMHRANGCGLAAVQVGVLRRVAVVEDVDTGRIFELINPRIVAKAGKQQDCEGCLSIPETWGITDRPMAVTVRAQNRNGEEVEYTGRGMLARAFCHEIDHLDGRLFTDVMIRRLRRDEVE